MILGNLGCLLGGTAALCVYHFATIPESHEKKNALYPKIRPTPTYSFAFDYGEPQNFITQLFLGC